MLSENKYNSGLAIAEQLKYNINYDKSLLFDVICSYLATYLLEHEYANELNEEQLNALDKTAK